MKTGRESLCRNYYIPLKRQTVGNCEYSIVPLRCKSWECVDCRKDKVKTVKDRISKLFDGRKLWLLTLTYYHSRPPAEAWRVYNESWNRFKTAVVKRYGKFSFCRILESHKNSPFPHLHVILDKYLPPTYLNKEALSAGFGYQIDCTEINSNKAIAYVTKYLTKEWSNAESLAIIKQGRVRRVSYSRDLSSLPVIPGEWEPIGTPVDFDTAVDIITTDREWDGKHTYRKLREKAFDGYYFIHFLVDDLPAGCHARTDIDEWQPDDWVPK